METVEIRTEDEHWYSHKYSPEEQWPSITTVLGLGYPKGIAFQKWLVNRASWEEAIQVRDKAGERGTGVHKAAQKLLEDKSLVLDYEHYPLEEWKAIWGLINWYNDYSPMTWRKKDIERVLFDTDLKVAGTMDFMPAIKAIGKIAIDFKTSSTIQNTHRIQVSQYAKMAGAPIAGLVKLGARNKNHYLFEWWDMDSDKGKLYLDGFESALTIWKIERPKAKPRTIEVPKTLSLSPISND